MDGWRYRDLFEFLVVLAVFLLAMAPPLLAFSLLNFTGINLGT